MIQALYKIERGAKERAEKKGTDTALFQERKNARRQSQKLVQEFFAQCRVLKESERPYCLYGRNVIFSCRRHSSPGLSDLLSPNRYSAQVSILLCKSQGAEPSILRFLFIFFVRPSFLPYETKKLHLQFLAVLFQNL